MHVHRPADSLEVERADLPALDLSQHPVENPLGDEDLTGPRLGAQSRREVGDRPDGRVVVATGEADAPEGRVPLRDADPEPASERTATIGTRR